MQRQSRAIQMDNQYRVFDGAQIVDIQPS